ncbi:MAG: sulfurtransferase TusA family protein [Acidimicrobiales bacterium]|nr:sulfurtransferase TusA family protein [Acidimicrobiales bacterium]
MDATGPALEVADGWDAGDLGCGELVIVLRARLAALRPGQVFQLLATDPGVRHDLPAWAGLTGHRLAHADPPRYLIIRREDS